MRLRLTVQRNSLPAAHIVWHVPDTASRQTYTVARLLEDINHVMPLEAEQWGLEDYAVEVGGFECLHFSPVVQALKEDDHVIIRPLLTADIRSRTLSGRYQISDGGQHLVDGISFGRPYLRQPNRPSVNIPPRKRARLLEEQPGELEEPEYLGQINGNSESIPPSRNGILTNGAMVRVGEGTPQSSNSNKSVHFKQPEAEYPENSDEDEDEDDDDFAPGAEDEGSSSDDDEESSSASDTSDPDTSSASESEEESSSSESDSDSDASASPEVLSANPFPVSALTKFAPPGQGSAVTIKRQQRRARSQKLNNLKKSGKLPLTASFKELEAFEQCLPIQQPEQSQCGEPSLNASTRSKQAKRKRSENDEIETAAVAEQVDLESRKQDLLVKLGSEATAAATESPAKPSPKRLRPDVSAISRIIGHQAKRLEKKQPKATGIAPQAEASPEPEGASDPDFWKSKIKLSAFECWFDGITLAAPPFPFKQHWDPASKSMREQQKDKSKKGGKKKIPPAQDMEDSSASIVLDYDERPTTEIGQSDAAAIEEQLVQEAQAAAKTDLPALPEDPDSLPELRPEDVKAGAIIAFKLWRIDAVTVTPVITGYKTAVVEKEGEAGNGGGNMQLKLAERDVDRKEKKFDSEGNRVYDAADSFTMMDAEEDDGDEGTWVGAFAELIGPKLLEAA